MEILSQEAQAPQQDLYASIRPKTIFSPLENQQLQAFRYGAIVLYILAYLYVTAFFGFQTFYFFPIAIGLVVLIEFLAAKLSAPFFQMEKIGGNRLEATVFLTMTLAQALSLSIWGFHYQLEFFQFLSLHLTFGFYLLSRTGWLTQGRLGIMVWFDNLCAFFILPFKHYLAGVQAFIQAAKSLASDTRKNNRQKQVQQVAILAVSLLVAALLVFFVWSQLSQVSSNFASLTSGFGDFTQQLFTSLFSNVDMTALVTKLWLALPISLYLYGMITGGLLGKKENRFSYQRFQENIRPLQVFPAFTAYIVIGSLCLTYALFFITGLSELSNLISADTASYISPQDASSVAVAGFWQLVRVSLLNFAVLGGFYLVSKRPLWDQKATRLATTILFVFASLLALLAGWKLFGIYIFLYGPTPLRLLSGWFVLVLLVWCMLTLIRLYKPIQAIRIGIFYALISFTLLCYLYPLLLVG